MSLQYSESRPGKLWDMDPTEIIAESMKTYPEISLEAEWTRQAQNPAKLFAKELKFKTHDDYIATLPKFEPQPEEYRRRLDIPVIVETRIPLKRMLELAGIDSNFDVDSIGDWEKDNFKTPEEPYTTYLNDGTNNLDRSTDAVRTSLRNDERGGTIFDGIALYLKDPEILKNHYLNLPGSRVGSNCAPWLSRWSVRRPKVAPLFIEIPFPSIGSVVAGRKISIKS